MWGRCRQTGLVALLVFATAGCMGLTRNPTRPRYWFTPFGDIVRRHGKPAGLGYYDDYDPRSVRLEVHVLKPCAPLKSQQIILATILDEQGRPLSRRRVEWMLEGSGQILEVDESGITPGRGYKVDNRYAVSHTSGRERRMNWHNGRPEDDVVIGEGQTWCIVSSATPGETQLTVWAPAIANRDANRQVVTLRWGEGGAAVAPAILPPPVGLQPVGPAGQTPLLPPTGLQPVGHVPDVSITQTAPSSVSVGDEVPVNLVVRNMTREPARFLTVKAALDPDLELIRAEPPAVRDGDHLIWTLDELPADGHKQLQLLCRSRRIGPNRCAAAVLTGKGASDQKAVTVQVLPREEPRLKIEIAGQTSAWMIDTNMSIPLQVNVSNIGTGPATDVVLKSSLEGLTETKTGLKVLESRLGTIMPGTTRAAPLLVRPTQAGRAVCRLSAEGADQVRAQAEHVVSVQEAPLQVKVNAPARRYIGRPLVWDIEVINSSSTPLDQVVVRDILPGEVQFTQASPNAYLRGREVIWSLGRLQPGERRPLKLTAVGRGMNEKSTNRVFASALAGRGQRIDARAESVVSIQGLAALHLSVADRDDPIEAGARTAYRMVVVNKGTTADRRVQLVGHVPANLKILGASGPVNYQIIGQQVTFSPVETLAPGASITCTIEVEAVKPGDARFRGELTSASLTEPVFKEESTNVR